MSHTINPQVTEEPESLVEALEPFQAMLQTGLAPLLAPAPGPVAGAAGGPAASLPLLLKMLKHLKATEDAAGDDEDAAAAATATARMLCDVGMQVGRVQQ